MDDPLVRTPEPFVRGADRRVGTPRVEPARGAGTRPSTPGGRWRRVTTGRAKPAKAAAAPAWPAGGGAAGALLRDRDWSRSALGPSRDWPDPVRVAVDMVLGAPLPAALLWDRDGLVLYNDAFAEAVGARHPAAFGAPAAEGLPELWLSAGEILREALDGGVPPGRMRAGDGAEHVLVPVRGADGAAAGLLLIACPDAARGNEARLEAILSELHHRVRNSLAVIRSIARRTAETSRSVEDYAMHLDGRLNAFARVQGAVTRDPGSGVDLEGLVADELLAYQIREGSRARIGGPPVRLTPSAAETIGLAIHELATNAVEHGALAGERGRVAVTWRVEGTAEAGRLAFTWCERGGRRARPPTSKGFGLNLLERTLAYDLKGRCLLDFAPEGLTCRIEVPLTPRIAACGPPPVERPARPPGNGAGDPA
ncbi:sensor histidine kinase [Methylobacterium nigriterrae]|uniref:sensor histidine kinase n=1 Tax=Methylobacterium nigriterrae TaxID=3127512 RepID=UPI003013BF5E